MKHGKKYIAVKKLVDNKKLYTIEEAVDLTKKTSTTKFDSSIEIAIKLNVDTTKAEQQLRGTIALPYYFGKQTRVLALDDMMTKESAKECGADYFGGNDKVEEIKAG
jgi:large subunit ribosomal protein L1